MVKKHISGLLRSGERARKQLRVQVFQGPALQCEYQTFLDKVGRVRIGKSKHAELSVPYSLFATDVLIFAITKWGAKVYLDPRFSGFVSDGQRFGEVRDFIAPRGALKELGSVLEPFEVSIPVGSRGTLEIGGYTVVFRVDKYKPEPAPKKMIGAPKAPFALPEAQSTIEKAGFLLGCLFTVLVTVPAVQWLNKAPFKEFKSMSDLSPFRAVEIIHPEHLQILPWVFGADFDSSQIVAQAITWVDELRKKWQAEDVGEVYDSSLAPLRGFSRPENVGARRRALKDDLETEWQELLKQRDSAPLGTFVRGQTAYAPMRVIVSGGERGSLTERVRARIEKINRTQKAIVSLIETEHGFMKDYFAAENAEIKQIFDPPKEPGLFFRLAEKAFIIEHDHFHAAESFAALGREKRKFAGSERSKPPETPIFDESFVWSESSLTIPHVFQITTHPRFSGNEADLIKNAKLSVGVLPPPPPPKLIPKIDMGEVESYVRGRSAEVKACYDLALGRNPQVGGSVLWRWTIDANGRVLRTKVSSTTIRDSLFLKCLEKKIKAWVFPRPENGPISISFPFRFVVRENMQSLEQNAR